MAIIDKIRTTDKANKLAIAELDNQALAEIITDALVVTTYVPKLIIDKNFSEALKILFLTVDEYGENYLDFFKDVWGFFRNLDDSDMRDVWFIVREEFDLPEEYDQFELEVEKWARLPIISSAQIEDLVDLLRLLLTDLKGKNFIEAVGEIIGNFKGISGEFTDTLNLVKEWIKFIDAEKNNDKE